MKNSIYNILLFSTMILLGCNQSKNSQNFEEYELYYSSTFGMSMSTKFNQSDTAYTSFFWLNKELKDSAKIDSIYYFLINSDQKDKLNELIIKSNFEKLDSGYYSTSSTDGDEFNFYVKTKKNEKITYFYTREYMSAATDSLMHFTLDLLPDFKDLYKSNRKIIFKSKIQPEPEPTF